MTVLMAASYRRTPVRVWSVSSGLHLFVIFVLGWGFIVLAPPGSQVAAWWPAAGASAIFVFRVRTSERLYAYALLIASTTLSNLVAERPPVVSICFGVANAAEVAVMVGVVTWRSPARPDGASASRSIHTGHGGCRYRGAPARNPPCPEPVRAESGSGGSRAFRANRAACG